MRRERSAVLIRLVLPVVLVSLLYAAGEPALGSGSKSFAPLPRCSAHGYGPELQTLPRTETRQAAVMLTGGWVTAADGRHSCVLQTTIRLTVAGAGGVTANSEWHVRAVLHPWSSVEHTWVWRNWCGAGGDGEVTVALKLPNGKTISQGVPDPPTCVDASAPSTVADVGTGPKYVQRHGDRLAPHILPKGAPPSLHQALVKVKNAWVVSDGYTVVAVYAGSPGDDASHGRFVALRQNSIFGIQYPPDVVNLGRVGAIRITRAPKGAAHETSAQRGELFFVSARGARGILELDGDRVRMRAAASS